MADKRRIWSSCGARPCDPKLLTVTARKQHFQCRRCGKLWSEDRPDTRDERRAKRG